MRRGWDRTRGGGPPSGSARDYRVLIIVQNLPLARDRRVRQEAQALVEAGFGVSVICPAPEERRGGVEVVDGISVYSYRCPGEASGKAALVLEFLYCWLRTALLAIKVLRRDGFDVIQACNPPDTYFLLGWLAKPLGKSFVFDHHDLCPELFATKFRGGSRAVAAAIRALERATFRTADHVIATNDSYRQVALARGRRAPETVSVVRSAPDLTRLQPTDPVPALRNGREHLCCYLGVMGSQDGVDLLMEAVAVIVGEMGRHDCHFALLGSGPCLDDLRDQARRLGIEDWVTFTGWADDPMIREYLSTADLGLTPDPKNDFNDRCSMNKVIEYMAMGLPVVAFDLDETMVAAGGAGEFAPGNDVEIFAKTIVTLLDNPGRRRVMGNIGRRRAREDLSWNAQVGTYLNVYEDLVEARAGARSRVYADR